MKTMTLHEILLLNYSIVLRFDETIRATPLRHDQLDCSSHSRDAIRQNHYDWWKQWTPQIVLGANDLGSHESSDGEGETFSSLRLTAPTPVPS